MKTNVFKKGLRLWPVLVFIACLAVTVGFYWVYGEHNLDADISSEFVLANLLNSEGRLMTENWFYSTEVRVTSPVPVYQLMLRLFSDWHVARTVSIAVLLCCVAASLTYMARGMGASYAAALLCASALVLPVTEFNSFTFVYGGFYTICVSLTFLEIGLVLRMDKRRLREPILLIILGFLGGLNGVRMIMICIAPLLAACLVTFFLEARRCDSLKKLVSLPSFCLVVGGVLCAVATFIGNAVNANILAEKYSFQLFDDTILCPLKAEMFTDQIMCLMIFFGYRKDSLLLSLDGVVSMLAVILPVLGAACTILLLRMKLNTRERLLAVFMPIALLLGIVINVLTLSEEGVTDPFPYAVSYYMPAALLLIFAIFWALDRFECRLKILRAVPMLALVGVFLASNAVYRENDMNTYETEIEDIAQMLVDEDCLEGYATFWNANILTELTDGKIDAFTIEDWNNFVLCDWLQRTDHMDRTPEGRMFAIFDPEDWENGVPGCDIEHLIYSSEDYFVCIYDSYDEFESICEAW